MATERVALVIERVYQTQPTTRGMVGAFNEPRAGARTNEQVRSLRDVLGTSTKTSGSKIGPVRTCAARARSPEGRAAMVNAGNVSLCEREASDEVDEGSELAGSSQDSSSPGNPTLQRFLGAHAASDGWKRSRRGRWTQVDVPSHVG